MRRKALMLVSDLADQRLRDEVARGLRPCPEYLQLERAHDVELLDWSRLPGQIRRRSPLGSIRHVAAATRRLSEFDVIFSDGEHLGIPLALAMRASGIRKPHLVLGHHITTPAKRRLWRLAGVNGGVDRILLHSRHQLRLAEERLGVRADRLAFLPYFADANFWSPANVVEEPLIVSAGREHRDYETLAAAAGGLTVTVEVAVGSLFSPAARWRAPATWPPNFHIRPGLDRVQLRELYARASLVVVPVLPTDFQAGVTTLLEAMAMAKPVVISATPSQVDIVEDGVTGVLVPPRDPAALRDAITALIGDLGRRRRLGLAARHAIETKYSLELFSSRIAAHLDELAAGAVPRLQPRAGPGLEAETPAS